MKAVKLLNLHMLELFVNYMTTLTASMETSVEQYRGGSEGCLIARSTEMDSCHVLAKCVSLDNIKTNSGHVQK